MIAAPSSSGLDWRIANPSNENDFFLSKPGRISERLMKVFPFEIGIVLQNLAE